MIEWRCPNCGEELPPPTFPAHYRERDGGPRRKPSIPLTLELLSILGFTLISISVAVSVFVVYRISNTINGDVTSKIGQLQQNIETLTTTVNGDVLSQIGEVRQQVSNVTVNSSTRPSINVQFTCHDSATGLVLNDCLFHIRVLEETPVLEFDTTSNNKVPILITVQRRLEITAQKDGYRIATEIFEYIDDGLPKSHSIGLEKIQSP